MMEVDKEGYRKKCKKERDLAGVLRGRTFVSHA